MPCSTYSIFSLTRYEPSGPSQNGRRHKSLTRQGRTPIFHPLRSRGKGSTAPARVQCRQRRCNGRHRDDRGVRLPQIRQPAQQCRRFEGHRRTHAPGRPQSRAHRVQVSRWQPQGQSRRQEGGRHGRPRDVRTFRHGARRGVGFGPIQADREGRPALRERQCGYEGFDRLHDRRGGWLPCQGAQGPRLRGGHGR